MIVANGEIIDYYMNLNVIPPTQAMPKLYKRQIHPEPDILPFIMPKSE